MKAPADIRRKQKIQFILFVSAIALISLALYFLVYSPQLKELASMKKRVEVRQEEIAKEVEAQSIAVSTGKDEVARWNKKIRALKMRLPDREDFEALLLQMGSLARKNNLREFRLRVKQGNGDKVDSSSLGGQPVPGTVDVTGSKKREDRDARKLNESGLPVGTVDLEITFTSKYRDMAYFIQGLTGTMRAMSIERFTLEGEDGVMRASMDVRAYFRKKGDDGYAG